MSDPEQHHPESRRSRPNIIPWPPVILLGAIVAGWLLGKLSLTVAGLSMTAHYPLGSMQVWLGWLLIGSALLLDVWVLLIFRKHTTHIRPDRPATTLVETGPFRYSRNPVYVGNVAIVSGLALTQGSAWYALLAVVTFCLIQELAVKREEAHLAMRFGKVWQNYAASTRRWL